MKAPSPLLGFNNNVKHKGRVFHIQTEDSGIKHPHVITHLFVDGGRILKSIKTSYAEFLEDEQMAVKVRQLMQEQHKAMFIALRAGKFDHLVEGEPPPPPPSSEAASAKVPSAGQPQPGPPPSSQASESERRARLTSDTKAVDPAAAAAKSESRPEADAKLDVAKTEPTKTESTKTESTRTEPTKPEATKPEATKAEAKDDAPPISTQPLSLRSAQLAGKARPPTSPPTRTDRGSAPPHPVSLRPPSLIPPPPRAPSPSMSSIQASGNMTLGDRKTDPRAETEQAMPAADPRPRVNSPLELNLEALERASVERTHGPVSSGDLRDLPPPPAAVLGKKLASIDTSYRSIAPPRVDNPAPGPTGPGVHRSSDAGGRTPPPPPTSSPGVSPPQRPRTQPFAGLSRPPTSERRSVTPQGARYAPSRPASIFGSARPQEGSSIFGEDLISEKSLDEVILGYLAEDLEGSKPKKG